MAPKARVKSEIKKIIRRNDNPFNIKGKNVFHEVTKNLGIIIPRYINLRSTINRNINKNFPKEISSWEDIPEEHDFYKTLSGQEFIIKKMNCLFFFSLQTS